MLARHELPQGLSRRGDGDARTRGPVCGPGELVPARGLVAHERRLADRPSATGPVAATTASSAARHAVDDNDPSWIHGASSAAPRCASAATTSSRIPATRPPLESANLTVAAWVRGNGSPGSPSYVVSKGSFVLRHGVVGPLHRRERRHGLLHRRAHAPEHFIVARRRADTIWDGKWHHVAGTFDGSTRPALRRRRRRSATEPPRRTAIDYTHPDPATARSATTPGRALRMSTSPGTSTASRSGRGRFRSHDIWRALKSIVSLAK